MREGLPSIFDAIRHDDIAPDAVAFEYFGVKFPYSRLYNEIERTARAFRQQGIGRGDIVSIMLPTLPETLYALYALNRIGTVANMIDIRSTPQQLKACLERTGSKVLLIMTFYLKTIETVREDLPVDRIILLRGCDSMPSFVLFWYKFGELFNGRRIISGRSGKYCFWDRFISAGASFSGSIDDTRHSDEAAVIFQTSGTTGTPKSVVHSNWSINNSADWVYRMQNDPQPGDRVLSILPAFAFFGFVTNVHMALMNRMTDIIIPLFDYHQFGKLIARHRPNYMFGIPSHWENIVKTGDKFGNLNFIKDVSVAGEVVNPELKSAVNAFLKANGSEAEVSVAYGMTETGGLVSLLNSRLGCKDMQARGNVGRPMPYVNVRIFQPDGEEEVGCSELGEVCLQTDLIMKGYLNNPDATAELLRLHSDGQRWMHTGDLGYLSESGDLFVVGRIKRMIARYDGTKIFPVEIENAFLEHPGVKECVVVSAPDPDHIQARTPYAFIVPASAEVSISDLKRFAEERLPVHMRPSGIRLIESIPTTGIGKPDIAALQNTLK